MKIFGINKLTLMDFPNKTACILFVGGCNMRCPYCHNSTIVEGGQPIDQADVADYLTKRRHMLEGVVISGGEPTIYPDLPQYIADIRAMGYSIKLDTNGTNPDMIQHLLDNQLVDYVAMDIKNSLDKYPTTAGVATTDTDNITRSIALLMASCVPHEFRTTVVSELHNADSFVGIADMIAGADRYFLQCYSDNGETFDSTLSAPTELDMQRYLSIVEQHVKHASIR